MNSTLDKAPEPWYSWLNHSGSITDKLKAVTTNVRLDVRRHEWHASDAWDKQQLHFNPEDTALHREIVMWANTDCCWYARTILPRTTYQAEETLFSRLGIYPLGELIWNNPTIQRTQMTHFSIHPQSPEYDFLTPIMHQGVATLWARLSTFLVHDTHPFYLLEIFLPNLRKYSS